MYVCTSSSAKTYLARTLIITNNQHNALHAQGLHRGDVLSEPQLQLPSLAWPRRREGKERSVFAGSCLDRGEHSVVAAVSDHSVVAADGPSGARAVAEGELEVGSADISDGATHQKELRRDGRLGLGLGFDLAYTASSVNGACLKLKLLTWNVSGPGAA